MLIAANPDRIVEELQSLNSWSVSCPSGRDAPSGPAAAHE